MKLKSNSKFLWNLRFYLENWLNDFFKSLITFSKRSISLKWLLKPPLSRWFWTSFPYIILTFDDIDDPTISWTWPPLEWGSRGGPGGCRPCLREKQLERESLLILFLLLFLVKSYGKLRNCFLKVCWYVFCVSSAVFSKIIGKLRNCFLKVCFCCCF